MTDLFGAAHARATDPDTSHEAAAVITPDLRQLQVRVVDYARAAGPTGFTDAQMEDDLDDAGSTYRTRRSELTARNIILDSGKRRTHGESTRQRVVWVHRDFATAPPPIIDAPTPASPADRQQARVQAALMDKWADQLRREGRMNYTDLTDTAALLRRLSA